MEVLVWSASRGLAPHEGLVLPKLKVGRTRPLVEPRRGPHAGRSEYPGSQNADTGEPKFLIKFTVTLAPPNISCKNSTLYDFLR